MPERKGSSYSRELFEKSSFEPETRQEWDRFDSNYNYALSLVAEAKKRSDLLELDHFIHDELPALIHARSPPYLQHMELSQLMKWKLTRGKSRPLQKLVDSNTSVSVIDASTLSFHYLQEGNMEDAFDAIMKLRGVGVATASAVFAILYPDKYPFMADEVIESVTNEGKEYTMTIYTHIKDALIQKGRELGWTAERVGRALWTCSMINTHQAAERKHQRQLARAQALEATIEAKTEEGETTRVTISNTSNEENPEEGANKRRKLDS